MIRLAVSVAGLTAFVPPLQRSFARRAHALHASAGPAAGGRKKVVFLGTPQVAATTLELLLDAAALPDAAFEVAAVVSMPPAPRGRKKQLVKSPVQELAEARGVPLVWTPPLAKDEAFLQAFEDLRPDLAVTAAYGAFLPKRFLATPTHGTVNVHPSLLPRWRGAAPVQRTLEAGDADAGVSVVFTVLKMDAGPVLRQVVRPLDGDEKSSTLLEELFQTGTAQLLEVLPSVFDGSAAEAAAAQDEELATAAPKLSAAEAAIDVAALAASAVHNKVRAFETWPGAWIPLRLVGAAGDDVPALRLKLLTTRVAPADAAAKAKEAAVQEQQEDPPPGTIAVVGKAAFVACQGGTWLELVEVQPTGKKPMPCAAWLNGWRGTMAVVVE